MLSSIRVQITLEPLIKRDHKGQKNRNFEHIFILHMLVFFPTSKTFKGL